MKALTFICLLFPLICCAQSGAGDSTGGYFLTADRLAAQCRTSIRVESDEKSNWIDLSIGQLCNGYLQGAVDTFEFERQTGVQKYSGQSACVPSTVNVGQLVRVYVKYADEHPEELHLAGSIMVWNAIHKAFPCSK
jgi:hypothetical protein